MKRSARYTIVLLFAGVLCFGVNLPKNAAPKPPSSVQRILKKSGLKTPETCINFKNFDKLSERSYQWHKAIDKIAQSHPQFLHAWITGHAKPPKFVTKEVIFQRNCMLQKIVNDAADSESELLLDYGKERPQTKSEMKQQAKKLTKSQRRAKRIFDRKFTKSYYRDAKNQASIWRNKYLFKKNKPFNWVSEKAADKCKLRPRRGWHSAWPDHKRCWRKTLSPEERQREILTASSAPGLSRHHWGTEFDLFGLNPRRFKKRGDLYDEYQWLDKNARQYGFFQPFSGPSKHKPHTYIEERWHWSYYPVARALSEYIRANPDKVEKSLNKQWYKFESRWTRGKNKKAPEKYNYFNYVRKYWRDYVFTIADIDLS